MHRKASAREKRSSSRARIPRLRPGDAVAIANSWSSDVAAGAVGRVANRMSGGYAVQVKGQFTDALGRRGFEMRCLFFTRSQLKKLPDAL